MSASPATRRAIAEIDFGDGSNVGFRVGNRSIHQFWHLFASHFRHVFLAPQRRADSGKVAWTWREAAEKRPVTATELAEVRRRLSEAIRSLSGGFGGIDRNDEEPEGASGLEAQVRATVGEMVGQLLAQRDPVLSGFVCRTDAGLMLHSWGASVASRPYFPDAQNGEISGTLFVGSEHPAGVSVVLENTQGVGGARVKSDRDGGFRFPSVAPGNYRIRVADHSDFPSGLSVTMERESITGLELHSASDEPLSVAGTVTALTDDVAPWYQRRWVLMIVLLLVIGFSGVLWWRSNGSPAVTTASSETSSGWQSAKGQLASGEAKNSGSDNGKVGEDRGFSTLSNSIPSPKMLVAHPTHVSSKAEPRPAENVASPSEDSVPSDRTQGQPLQPEPAGKPIRGSAAPVRRSPSETASKASGNPVESNPSDEDASGSGSANDESKQPENKSAKSSRPVADKKQASPSSASSPSSNLPEDEEPSSTGSEVPPDSTVASAASPSGGKSHQHGGAKNSAPAGSAASPPAENAAAEPAAEAPDAAASATAPVSKGGLKPNAAKRGKETAKADIANSSVLPAIAPAAAAASDAAQAEAAATEPTAAGKSSGSAPSKKNASPFSPQSSSSPESTGQLNPDNGDSSATLPAESAASPKKKEKKAATVSGNSESPAKSDADDSASASDDAKDTPAAQPSGAAAKQASARSKSPGKAVSSTSPSQDQPAEAERGPSPAASVSGEMSSSLLQSENNAESLIGVGTIRASAWKARLTRDLILPTRPLTATEEEQEETMRKKLRQDRLTQLPKAFQQPVARSGFSLEFVVDGTQANVSPQWKNDAGIEPAGSSVRSNRAELDWAGAGLPADSNYVLGYPDGRVVARVSVDQNGVPTLKTASGVRAWYWLGIERSGAGDSSSAANQKTIFDWELLNGGAIPASWKQDDQWLDGRGQRVAIPLEPAIRTGSYEIALIDPGTGWALVSTVALNKP